MNRKPSSYRFPEPFQEKLSSASDHSGIPKIRIVMRAVEAYIGRHPELFGSSEGAKKNALESLMAAGASGRFISA